MTLFKDYGITIKDIETDTETFLKAFDVLTHSDNEDETANAIDEIGHARETIERMATAFIAMAKENGYTE